MSVESMVWALRYADLPPREKLLLIGIASHDGDGGAWPSEATLAEYVGTSDRHVRRLIASLVEHGFLTVHVNQGGTKRTRGDRRPNLYELHRPEITIPASRVDISVTTGGHFEQERVDIQTSTESSSETPGESSKSSSLRSEEELNAKEVLNSRARSIVTEYWDWHKVENGGQPAETFQALLAVVKASLIREYGEDEILDAMKLEPRTLTSKRVIQRVGFAQRAREERPSTASIPGPVIRAFNASLPWLRERGFIPAGQSTMPHLLDALATMNRWGYDLGETMIRLAVALHAYPVATVSAVDLRNVNSVPRFPGGLADYPDSLERAYKNKGWRV